jgi:hypothetical protein
MGCIPVLVVSWIEFVSRVELACTDELRLDDLEAKGWII